MPPFNRRARLTLESLESREQPASLSYLSYFGGDNSDEVKAVAVDPQGNIYVAGRVNDGSFPPVASMPSFFDNGYVSKFDPSGTTLLNTMFFETDTDGITGLAVDSAGSAYVVGTAGRSGLATAGAAQTTYAGSEDVFVAKLNPACTAVVYATYIGGLGLEEGHAIAVDSAGAAFVTGFTTSDNFPTHNAIQGSLHANSGLDAFVTKISPNGSSFLFSTYFGGDQHFTGLNGATITEANAITLDSAGNPYIAGRTEAADLANVNAFQTTMNKGIDAFVTKFKADGSQVLYSSFLGNTGEDIAYGVAVDHSGNILLTGSTTSGKFPIKNAFQPKVNNTGIADNRDAFITKLNPNLSGTQQLVYSTFDGGSANEDAYAITTDAAGNAYVVGNVSSQLNFRKVNTFAGQGPSGGLFVKLSPTGRVLINAAVGVGGETGQSIVVDGFGNVVFAGHTYSDRMRTTANAYQPDFPAATDTGFISRIDGNVKSLSFIDEDDDRYTVRLSGLGSLNVVQNDPDGNGKGPMTGIYAQNTTSSSRITVKVRRVGDGEVDIGEIKAGDLGSITAAHSNLVGAGVSLTGDLGSLTIQDVLNGADILAVNAPTKSTRITAHDIGNNTAIDVGGAISMLRAARVGQATIDATRLTTLTVRGDKLNSISGDFAAAVTLSGAGVVMNSATIAGTVSGANFNLGTGELRSFRATEFDNSNITAVKVDRVLIGKVQTINGTKFGIHATDSLGLIRVTDPAFTYNHSGQATQGKDDFEVKLG